MIGWVTVWAFVRAYQQWQALARTPVWEMRLEISRKMDRLARELNVLFEHMSDADRDEGIARVFTGWERDDDPRGGGTGGGAAASES